MYIKKEDLSKTIKFINQGYLLGKFTPPEILKDINEKIYDLKNKTPENDRFKCIYYGFSIAQKEREKYRQMFLKQREGQLKVIKKSKSRENSERGRNK